MKTIERRKAGPGGFALVEEAVHLLRIHAGLVLPAYFVGSLPFILGLLYFWADTSRSSYAAQHLIGASLGMAMLFVWMKFWQAIFVEGLRARISASPPTRWNLRRALRVLLIQTAIQPSGLFILPLAILAAGVPFPWVYAFYQNVTALTDGETAEIRQPLQRAWRQAMIWPGQNHLIVFILGGFGLCVLLNLESVCYFLPQLLKTLFGVESVYTQSSATVFNTTFQAAMFGLAYLCLDPIVKTVYLLRCFYGESLSSGEDLKAELKRIAISAPTAVAALIFVLCFVGASISTAADGPPATDVPAGGGAVPGVSAPQLDRAIDEVIHQPKYTWRMPREKIEEPESQHNALVRFIIRAVKAVGNWVRDAIEWVMKLLEKWLGRMAPSSGSSKAGTGWITLLQFLMFALLAAVLCALAILLLRSWQNRRRQSLVFNTAPVTPTPDLADENVAADQLPEDGWIKLGRDLLSKGELRLALRAFYFASLAHLDARKLLTIAKFKSNRDYERELGRRGHSLPGLRLLFGENVLVFDRSWYGLHDVNEEMVGRFVANLERIKGF
jgi:hypothetical protein